MDPNLTECFDKIYSTDLVFANDCWRLCGDAHCCSFTRYKAKFKLLAQSHFQELLLLPGEHEYLKKRGWAAQFGEYETHVYDYDLDFGSMKIESIVSHKPNCACDHDLRPAICRLYPLLPVYDVDGRVTGIERFGIYEELEAIDDLSQACQLTSLPFAELQKFLLISSEIAKIPLMLFYISAYSVAKRHVRERLIDLKAQSGKSSFAIFERSFIRNKFIDHSKLRPQLCDLAKHFRERYGDEFALV